MRMGVVLIAAVIAISACDAHATVLTLPSSALHEVDGIQMTTEQPCNPVVTDWCARWLRRARTALALDAATTVHRIALAGPNGVFGGIARPVVVVLDLDDGTRRAVELMCGPTSFNATEPPASQDFDCTVMPR